MSGDHDKYHGTCEVPKREWVELSDEDQDAIFEEWHTDDSKGWVDLCNMVEAKLKELNT